MKRLLIGGCIVVLLLGLIALALHGFISLLVDLDALGNVDAEKQDINVELESIEDSLSVNDLVMTETDNGYNITGLIKNTSDVNIKGIEVIVSLYDKDKNKIGEAAAYSGRLKKGVTWKFEAVSFDSGVVDFDVDIEVLGH
jgi:hypothetical protein